MFRCNPVLRGKKAQGTPAIHLRSEQNVAKVLVGDGLVVVGGGFFFVSQCEI